jgi:hypothetical protein
MDTQKLLDQAASDANVPQVTDSIRERQHADKLDAALDAVDRIRLEMGDGIHALSNDDFVDQYPECQLLITEYPRVFAKAKSGKEGMPILRSMIKAIRGIETGKLDQHTASVSVGTSLKKMYIDPVINEEQQSVPTKEVSYSQWKQLLN